MFPDCGQEGLKLVHKFLLISQPVQKSVCLLTNAQVYKIPFGFLDIKNMVSYDAHDIKHIPPTKEAL